MLIKNHLNLERDCKITLEKFTDGEKSAFGAFPDGVAVEFKLTVSRKMGASGVVLRITRDTEGSTDIPFAFTELENGCDIYRAEFTGSVGLYFYEILLIRGSDTLFLSSVNNSDFTLEKHSGSLFHLLFYKKDFTTPDWVKGGTMYHIFADRFRRADGKVELHGTLNPDWEGGIPQFAQRAGDPLSNDVFFGGNLWGVIEKLDYLESLGVNIIYLSPIFSSVSNHRYDTSDYETVDSMLGGREAFDELIAQVHARNMRVILDGVFNHTGDDSKYFNRKHRFEAVGAYESEDSPYADWFSFTSFPDKYEAWWGIEIMPRLMHANESCRRYFTGENGIVAKWLKAGADGWRLDVADELSDAFLDELTETAKGIKDAFVIGEVWENAATKTSYGARRRYFQGGELDSVMNYPLRNAVLALLTENNTEAFYNTLTELYSSYPPCVLHCLMNIISTHDTQRITTVLGDRTCGEGKTNSELSTARLTAKDRKNAIQLLKIASTVQFTVFGIPSVYYGDETALEGYHDPFCRMPFRWDDTDGALTQHYKMLGALRKECPCLKDGEFAFLYRDEALVAYERRKGDDVLTVIINISDEKKEFQSIKINAKSSKIIKKALYKS